MRDTTRMARPPRWTCNCNYCNRFCAPICNLPVSVASRRTTRTQHQQAAPERPGEGMAWHGMGNRKKSRSKLREPGDLARACSGFCLGAAASSRLIAPSRSEPCCSWSSATHLPVPAHTRSLSFTLSHPQCHDRFSYIPVPRICPVCCVPAAARPPAFSFVLYEAGFARVR